MLTIRVRTEAEAEIEIYCKQCGKNLSQQSNIGERGAVSYIDVEPCPDCWKKEYDRGYENATWPRRRKND